MKIVFWGTPSYAVESLETVINKGHNVVGVVTQPDRKRNRGKNLDPSAIKLIANKYCIPTFTPKNIRTDEECQNSIKALNADIYIVVAFGQILPKEILEQPKYGCWNSHASLLPRWRGAAPIQWSLLSGDVKTGVGIMYMEEGLDTGPLLLEEEIVIGKHENACDLSNRLSQLSGDLLGKALDIIELYKPETGNLIHSKLNLTPQNKLHRKTRYARMITKLDNKVNWQETAIEIHRKVTGLYPNGYTTIDNKRVKIKSTVPLDNSFSNNSITITQHREILPYIGLTELESGKIINIVKGVGIIVGTQDVPIIILKAQFEGKKDTEGYVLTQHFTDYQGCYLT